MDVLSYYMRPSAEVWEKSNAERRVHFCIMYKRGGGRKRSNFISGLVVLSLKSKTIWPKLNTETA